MTAALTRAVAAPSAWLERFTRQDYEAAFREYQARYTASFLEAVREAGESGLEALADELLASMEAGWKQRRFWDRGVAKSETKQLLVGFVSPMLLAEPELRPFAKCLRDRWNARWPKDVYHAAEYERLRSGFKYKILGFELPEKKERPIEDDI